MADMFTAGAVRDVRGEAAGAQLLKTEPERLLRAVQLDDLERGTGGISSVNKNCAFLSFRLFLIIKIEMSFYDISITKL